MASTQLLVYANAENQDKETRCDQKFEGCAPLLCKEHATELSQLIPDFRNTFLMEW
jgi:uncharacterized Fe-S cluster-containing radical SAM superfamily protein